MFVKNVLPPTGTLKRKSSRKGKADFSSEEKNARRPLPHSLVFSLLLHSTSSTTKTNKHTAALMADVYDEHKDVDGFLYMTFSGENTFGWVAEAEAEEEAEELSLVGALSQE